MSEQHMSFEKSMAFTDAVERVIPGGAHTYSKGRDQFPEQSASGIVRGEGAWVWDADGNRMLDWGMGLMSVSLGHAHPEVVAAVCAAIHDGVTFSRPAALELRAAEKWLSVTGDEMVKFARHGSCVTTGAVKLARGYTGRKRVALPQEHPFFSFDDWFIGSTQADFGIPDENKKLTIKFSYNDIHSLQKLVDEYPGEIACVIMEPVKFDMPKPGFLEGVRKICTDNGIVLIFDEMQSGLKFAMPGAAKMFGVEADLTTWGKGIGNGFAISALSGRRDIMTLGGIDRQGEPKMFLLSATHGGEAVGLAALLKTIEIFERNNVIENNWATGERLKTALNDVIVKHGLEKYLRLRGYPCFMLMDTLDAAGQASNSMRTLLMQEMIARGVLFQGLLFLTPSHGDEELGLSVSAFDAACEVYAQAIDANAVEGFLTGPAIKPVFRKTV